MPNKSALTIPADLAALPGTAEAKAIRAAYATAQRGLLATVATGLLLAAAKERLPHGQFQAWIGQFLPDIGYRTANRAFVLAGHVWEEVLFYPASEAAPAIAALAREAAKNDNLSLLGEKGALPAGYLLRAAAEALLSDKPTKQQSQIVEVATEFLEGKSRQQLLFLAKAEASEDDELEGAAKAQCETAWKADPAARDLWEPRVLAGELKYGEALKGMLGQKYTAGKERADANYAKLIPRSLTTLRTGFAGGEWEKLPAAVQANVLNLFGEVWAVLPPEARARVTGEKPVKGGASK